MNKRLIELKIEAWDYACSKIPSDALGLKNHGDYFAEKLAELIIKEVLAVQEQLIAEGHNAWHVNKPTREHFGV